MLLNFFDLKSYRKYILCTAMTLILVYFVINIYDGINMKKVLRCQTEIRNQMYRTQKSLCGKKYKLYIVIENAALYHRVGGKYKMFSRDFDMVEGTKVM